MGEVFLSVCLPDNLHHTCIFCSFVPSVFGFGARFNQRLESDIGDGILSHSGIELGTQETGPRRQTEIIWADACICTAFGWMDTKGLICTVDYAKWVLEQRILERESCRTVGHAQLLLLFPVVLTVVSPHSLWFVNGESSSCSCCVVSSKMGIICASYLQHWLLPLHRAIRVRQRYRTCRKLQKNFFDFCVQWCGNYRRVPHSSTWLLCITLFDYFSHFYACQSLVSAKCILPVTTPWFMYVKATQRRASVCVWILSAQQYIWLCFHWGALLVSEDRR